MKKKLLTLIAMIFLSTFVYSDIDETLNNVRYQYISSSDTLTISAVDSSQEAKIDSTKYFDILDRIRIEKGISNTKSYFKEYDSTANYSINISSNVKFPDDASYLFNKTNGQINIDSNIDTSNVKTMSGMFSGATSANPDVSRWDTSNVIYMDDMFSGAKSANPDVSKWDVSNVISMSELFLGAINADPNVSNWNVSSVINMTEMFLGAINANPDVSNWDVRNVRQMTNMFSGVTSNPNVSNWNVSNVINMSGMFNDTPNANPDVSNWDVSNVKDMSRMFSGAISANPDVSNWNVSKVTNMSRMFYGAINAQPNLESLHILRYSNMYQFYKYKATPLTVEINSKITNLDAKNSLTHFGSDVSLKDSLPPGTNIRFIPIDTDKNEKKPVTIVPDTSKLGTYKAKIRIEYQSLNEYIIYYRQNEDVYYR